LIKTLAVLITSFSIAAVNIQAQAPPDPQLLSEINKIKAIDNHAHPLRYVGDGEKPDDEYDALPLEAIDPFPLPVRLGSPRTTLNSSVHGNISMATSMTTCSQLMWTSC